MSDYIKVTSSTGHVLYLPKSSIGISVPPESYTIQDIYVFSVNDKDSGWYVTEPSEYFEKELLGEGA